MLAMDIDPALIEAEVLNFCIVDESRLLSRENPAWRGLVLESIGSMEGAFKRVGYFHIAESARSDFLDSASKERKSEYPCEEHKSGEFVFTI